MKQHKSYWRDFSKGILLNLIYEGQSIFYQLVCFNLCFLVLQVAIGIRAVNRAPSLSLPEGKSYACLGEILQEATLSPYIFVGFLVLALVGTTAYLFWKDGHKAQSYYALRTLPVPRICNFLVKYLLIITSVASTYLMQFCAVWILLHWNYKNVQFRTDEWLLSVSETGFLALFFPPDMRFLLMVSFFLFVSTSIFVWALYLSGRITRNWLTAAFNVALVGYTLFSNPMDELSRFICLLVSILLLFCSALLLWDAYRRY